MNYGLVVLTHGESETLEATLNSFHERVTPGPSEGILLNDGPLRDEVRWPWEEWATGDQRGFCEATRLLWRKAAQLDSDYVFWLEHDFQFLRDVNLADLAAVMADRGKLAQMALMRTAVNSEEKAAGGLFESRLDQYTLMRDYQERQPPWLQHFAYFTTNPSLMRRSFMEKNPWPNHADQCEGRFGLDLRERGYYFGVWGVGDPWVEHVGVRSGFGY